MFSEVRNYKFVMIIIILLRMDEKVEVWKSYVIYIFLNMLRRFIVVMFKIFLNKIFFNLLFNFNLDNVYVFY